MFYLELPEYFDSLPTKSLNKEDLENTFQLRFKLQLIKIFKPSLILDRKIEMMDFWLVSLTNQAYPILIFPRLNRNTLHLLVEHKRFTTKLENVSPSSDQRTVSDEGKCFDYYFIIISLLGPDKSLQDKSIARVACFLLLVVWKHKIYNDSPLI